MIADNTKRLLLGIIIVLVLLSVCVSVDYASENNTTAIVVADNQTVNSTNDTNDANVKQQPSVTNQAVPVLQN